MTDNPFEAMMKMGQAWAKEVNPALESFTPKGFEDLFPTMPKEFLDAFMGNAINPDSLDAKTKLLLTLHGLTIAGAIAEPQIKLTVRHALEAEATPQEIAETIANAGLFGGIPAMTKAMELATEVTDQDKDQET